ncbi:MAG: asparagine synthase-related protein, partial [Flavobacteriales bacterium]
MSPVFVTQRHRDTESTEDKIVQKVKRVLDNSVKKRLIADVDVQTFLSGGIDSSYVTAVAKKYNPKIRGYTIAVDEEEKNELDSALAVGKHLSVEVEYDTLGEENFSDLCKDVILAYDEPFGDTSMVPTYLLCRHTANRTKVALSGDGGDELFFG